jgi:hypothetical protein
MEKRKNKPGKYFSTSSRIPRTPDGYRDLGLIFFMIFSLPGIGVLVDFQPFWRFERPKVDIPAFSSCP